MSVLDRLYELQDVEYGLFQAKLTPNVPADRFIGVRVPIARKLAKELVKDYLKEGDDLTGEIHIFMQSLPHDYFDENLLHGLIISEIKDYDHCIELMEKFLPYVDNWAVCDIISPKVFKKHKAQLLGKITEWIADSHIYTSRFGIEMLMSHFLDDDFRDEYLELPAAVHTDEYYLMMMNAWFYATALAKQWDATIPYLENNRLDTWVHNKTIQKARESFRITPEQKEYLKILKR